MNKLLILLGVVIAGLVYLNGVEGDPDANAIVAKLRVLFGELDLILNELNCNPAANQQLLTNIDTILKGPLDKISTGALAILDPLLVVLLPLVGVVLLIVLCLSCTPCVSCLKVVLCPLLSFVVGVVNYLLTDTISENVGEALTELIGKIPAIGGPGA